MPEGGNGKKKFKMGLGYINCKKGDDKYSKNSLIRNPVLENSLFCFFTRVLFPKTT